MFASRERRDINIGDVVVTITRLSGRKLEEAERARELVVATMSKNFGSEVLRAFREDTPEKQEERRAKKPTLEERRKARYTSYDRTTILRKGIIRWTATDERGNPVPIEEGVNDLLEEHAQKLHEEIVDYSLGPLSEEEVEAEHTKS